VSRKPPIKALVFDAYGTLFDVHSVIALCDELFPGQGAQLSQTWRAKQLEYTWLKSLITPRPASELHTVATAWDLIRGSLGLIAHGHRVGTASSAFHQSRHKTSFNHSAVHFRYPSLIRVESFLRTKAK